MRREERRDGLCSGLRSKIHRAGLLSCTAFLCAALSLPACALELAGMDAMETEVQTEGPHDELIKEAAHIAADALASVETDGDNIYVEVLLPDEAKEMLNSLDEETLKEYALMIDRILTNPDFQSLIQYQEVQELIALLIQNGLKTAREEPEMTEKILETLGIDSRLIALFYEVLAVYDENPEAAQKVQDFMQTEEGRKLLNTILETFDPETIDTLLQNYDSLFEAPES